jgi:hypothetical protein
MWMAQERQVCFDGEQLLSSGGHLWQHACGHAKVFFIRTHKDGSRFCICGLKWLDNFFNQGFRNEKTLSVFRPVWSETQTLLK